MLGYSFRLKVNAYLKQLNLHAEETDNTYFTVIVLIFTALSAIALNYQQYATSGVLYVFAVIIEFLETSIGRFTGRLIFDPKNFIENNPFLS